MHPCACIIHVVVSQWGICVYVKNIQFACKSSDIKSKDYNCVCSTVVGTAAFIVLTKINKSNYSITNGTNVFEITQKW